MATLKPAKTPAKKSINAAWHRAHRMPARATAAERLKWHEAHAKACGCRPSPISLKKRAAGSVLDRLRAICLGLPATTEVEAWGHPTFRVAGKIFVGCGETGDGGASMSVKTTHEMQAALVASEPRFTVAAYVGKHGWISMAMPAGAKVDWNEVEALVRGSYRLVAPARLAAALPAP